jgi:hypothetical protein
MTGTTRKGPCRVAANYRGSTRGASPYSTTAAARADGQSDSKAPGSIEVRIKSDSRGRGDDRRADDLHVDLDACGRMRRTVRLCVWAPAEYSIDAVTGC